MIARSLSILPAVSPVQKFKSRQLTTTQILDRFHPRTANSCVNGCHNNSSDLNCRAKTYDDWFNLLSHQSVLGVPLYADNEYLFDFERQYLNRPPFTDTQTLPDLNKSIIYHVNLDGSVQRKMAVRCKYRDTLTFRVDLKDGYDKRRERGGDLLRVWITELTTKPREEPESSAGRVVDLRNGSHLATVQCVWTGNAKVSSDFYSHNLPSISV